MSKQAYLEAEAELFAIRERHNGGDSPEEETHLDEMDVLWQTLSAEEIQEINNLGGPARGQS